MSIYNVHRKGVMAGCLTPLSEKSTVTFKGIKVFSRGLLVVAQLFVSVWHCVCTCVSLNFDFFFAKIKCGLYFLDHFDVLMSKMIFKK